MCKHMHILKMLIAITGKEPQQIPFLFVIQNEVWHKARLSALAYCIQSCTRHKEEASNTPLQQKTAFIYHLLWVLLNKDE